MSSLRYGLDFSEDEVDHINSHRVGEAEFKEREGRARGRGEAKEEEEEEEGREGKSLVKEVETTSCQIENRDTEVKVCGAVGEDPSFSFPSLLKYLDCLAEDSLLV